MKEKVYEIELTQTELEILYVALHPSYKTGLLYDLMEYVSENGPAVCSYYNGALELGERIENIVNTNKHQNV